MGKESVELLEQINKSSLKINAREEVNEMSAETNEIISKVHRRVENSTNQIQNAFDRIHDKVFNFNNILIGAYLVLSTFPSECQLMELWTIIFPISIMIFLIYIDYRQMEIHRFAAGEMDFNNDDIKEYGNKIAKQTRLSLLSLFFSLVCLIYLITKITPNQFYL